ncbi:DDE-type integrase/transposase/recombinase [Streptomyces marokkonensis]|uniref:DDE-type integrase/transposase/recombinase n=1 Tax=Streptomyces marokkonensis TaxID=324855 RepID=A0ABW6QHN2_9ACTN
MTRQDHSAVPAPDLVLLDFTAPMPGLELVGDITCMPTAEGRLYPATVIDLCTREVVAWSMADHMRTQLVDDAIRMAHASGHTASNAIFHSDGGSRYTSRQFRFTQAELDIRRSFGRTGLRFANAAAGSFFAILKAEIGTTGVRAGAELSSLVFGDGQHLVDHAPVLLGGPSDGLPEQMGTEQEVDVLPPCASAGTVVVPVRWSCTHGGVVDLPAAYETDRLVLFQPEPNQSLPERRGQSVSMHGDVTQEVSALQVPVMYVEFRDQTVNRRCLVIR